MTSNRAKDTIIVINDKGLHTRPATELVKCASAYKSTITLYYQDISVNAKSLLGILMLAAAKGAKIGVEAIGDDATSAVEALKELSVKKFNIQY